MDRISFISLIFIFVAVSLSHTCNASLVFHVRKLIAGVPHNDSVTPQVAPTGSPVIPPNTTSTDAGKSQEHKQNESQMDNQNSSAPSPPAIEKSVDRGYGNATTVPNSGDNGSCGGSLTNCRDKEMLACIEDSKGSKKVVLVVQNEGETTLKVNVKLPNYLSNVLPEFEVPKHQIRRMDISSSVGKSTELIVNSGYANCTLPMVRSVSVDNLIKQLSFYSKQVTPIYAAYASILVTLVFGAVWACCKLSNRNQENVIPYQELEIGLPESVSAVNAGATEGWDQDWDDDDWEEGNVVKSPVGQHVRSVSVDGLTSRASKKDEWENDWGD